MRRKSLGILIPFYKETEEQILCLLDSIKIQQDVDFGLINVTMCGDGPESTKLDEAKLKALYPFKITIVPIPPEKVGISELRNICFDNSTDDYVMWCDADDMFYNCCGLWMIFKEMETGFDSLTSTFIVECEHPETGEIMFQNKENDTVFVHGKVHNRYFLLKEDIRWNPKLQIHEDSFFNIQCRTFAGDKFKYLPVSFYMWKNNKNSVSRRDPKYILKTFQMLMDSMDCLCEIFLNKGKPELAQQHATQMIYDTYFTLNSKDWIQTCNQEYRDTVENRFAEFYKKYERLFEFADENLKKQAIAGIKNRMFMEDSLFLEKITFDDWIAKFKQDNK